jgi:hypothetical protein
MQVTGVVPWHTPAVHTSTRVHALPSLHAVPSATGAPPPHTPVVGSHTPAWWHWSAAAHATGLPPVHTPATQTSVRVQALPSLHAVPSGKVTVAHRPVPGSQTPPAWH